MQFDWLNKQNNKNLIVFFNGWGGIAPGDLSFENFDVIMFYDYRTFENIDFDFSSYDKKYLIAWSLGVYVCNYYFDNFKNFDGFTAINGTQNPIDNNWGIPVNAYNLTVYNFNELTCKKFIKKIGTSLEINRSISELKQELISIRNLKPKKFFNFDRVIISKNDRIFPYKNMLLFWSKNNIQIEEINAPHYIFDKYKSWSDLI